MGAERWKRRGGDAGKRFERQAEIDPATRAVVAALFDQEKRLSKLEGKPAVSKAEFTAPLRGKAAKEGG